MKLRAAIFDFDGTLFDSMYVWGTAGAKYLRSIGRSPEEDLDKKIKAFSLSQAAAFMREKYDLPFTDEQIMAGVNKVVEQAYFYSVQPKDGAAAFLGNLKRHGVDMCIATATDRYQIEAALKRCGMYDFFSGILTCTEVGHGKEDPAIFREALRLLGSSREDSIVFEDAMHAVLTAKNDDFITAAVYDSHEHRQEQIRETADFYLTDMLDFDKFIKQVQAKKL